MSEEAETQLLWSEESTGPGMLGVEEDGKAQWCVSSGACAHLGSMVHYVPIQGKGGSCDLWLSVTLGHKG